MLENIFSVSKHCTFFSVVGTSATVLFDYPAPDSIVFDLFLCFFVSKITRKRLERFA